VREKREVRQDKTGKIEGVDKREGKRCKAQWQKRGLPLEKIFRQINPTGRGGGVREVGGAWCEGGIVNPLKGILLVK